MNFRSWKALAFLAAIMATVGGFGIWWWRSSGYVSTDDARVKASIVAISAELTAKLSSLTKEEGEAVAHHELLATLDRRELEISLRQAEAEAERLRNKAQQSVKEIELHIARQKEEVAKAEAALRAAHHQFKDARAHSEQAKEDWSRSHKLFNRALVAEQELERAKTSLLQAEAHMSTMQEKIKESELTVDLARIKAKEIPVMEADLQARGADVRRAEAVIADLNRKLQLTTIHSPVAGVVVKKNAHAGEVIQSGHPIYMVVDASRYWIEANVEETEIRYIRPGSPVLITVDSYPDHQFDGKVIEVGGATVSEFSLFTPQKLTGNFIKSTQRLPVRISVTNSNGALRVGMAAVVRIKKHPH